MKKITVKVTSDEWYPIIRPANKYFQENLTVSADLWKRYCAALEAFSAVRKELSDAIYD